MKSYLRLYQAPFKIEMNSWVENIDLALSESMVFENPSFQYIKHSINLSIDISIEQGHIFTARIGNYCSIRNEDDTRTYYYYIVKEEWKSSNCAKLTLVMDCVNTFLTYDTATDISMYFDKRTSVIREHLDRWKESQVAKGDMYPIIHRVSENIPVQLYKTYDRLVQGKINQSFYLVYRSSKDLSPSNIDNPINCYLLSDESLLLEKSSGTGSQVIITANDLTEGLHYFINFDENPNAQLTTINPPTNTKLDSTHRVFSIKRTGGVISASVRVYKKNGIYWDYVGGESIGDVPGTTFSKIGLTNVKNMYISSSDPTAYTDILNLTDFIAINSGSIGELKTIPFKNLVRTDNRIVKIIKLPYAPTDLSFKNELLVYDKSVWEYSEGMLKLKDLNKTFISELLTTYDMNYLIEDFVPENEFNSRSERNIRFESKLLHSDFYVKKFVYGSDYYSLKNEQFIIDDVIPYSLPIYFKVTNTINSKFLFHIDLDSFYKPIYQSDNDYEGYFTSARNNEVTIYNNDYINYIKNGFNYDKQRMEREQLVGWGTTGLQIAGSVVGAVVSTATGNPISAVASVGLGMSAINSIAGNITHSIENNKNLDHKLNTLKMQSTSVIGSDDIDLLDEFNKNRLHEMLYEPSERMKQLLFDLFYYCGYSNPTKHRPNLQSRYYFNYIQCDPVFSNDIEKTLSEEIITELKSIFNVGVTIYHYHQYAGATSAKDNYDFNQSLENWETSLLNK